MRPDEHKRKKNTQYKKKHGINEKATKSDGQSSKKTSDEKLEQTGTGQRRENGQERRDPPSTGTASSASSNDAAACEIEGATASFRRREITSNWRKYEIESEDEDDRFIQKRGTDFTQLLNHAGEAQSHFRLQDEVSWKDASDVGDVLALDCDRLSEALSCIPMYELLNIDKDVLSEKQVQSMKQDGMKNMRNFVLKSNKQTFIDKDKSSTAHADNNGGDQPCSSFKIHNESLNAAANISSSNAVHKLSLGVENTGKDTSKKIDIAQGYNAEVVNTIHCNDAQDTLGENAQGERADEDDELDFLLSLDKSHPELDKLDPVNTDIGSASSIAEAKAEDNPQTKLPNSKDIGSASSIAEAKAEDNPQTKLPNTKDNNEIDNLEDWLDSVLDA